MFLFSYAFFNNLNFEFSTSTNFNFCLFAIDVVFVKESFNPLIAIFDSISFLSNIKCASFILFFSNHIFLLNKYFYNILLF